MPEKDLHIISIFPAVFCCREKNFFEASKKTKAIRSRQMAFVLDKIVPEKPAGASPPLTWRIQLRGFRGRHVL